MAVCACSIAGIGESAHVIVLHPRGTSRTGGLSRGWWTDAGFAEQFQRQAPASYAKWTDRERDHARVGRVSLPAAPAWFDDIPGDAAERIRSASLPTMTVIAGDADLLTGVQPVADYAAAIGAELVWLAACGHYPWVEQPAAFRDAVTTWLGRD